MGFEQGPQEPLELLDEPEALQLIDALERLPLEALPADELGLPDPALWLAPFWLVDVVDWLALAEPALPLEPVLLVADPL